MYSVLSPAPRRKILEIWVEKMTTLRIAVVISSNSISNRNLK